MAKLTLEDYIKEEDQRIAKEEELLWNQINMAWAGPTNSPSTVDLSDSQKYQEIIQILHRNPIMVQPCLDWLMVKAAEMEVAKLVTLYGEEKAMAMIQAQKEAMDKENGKEPEKKEEEGAS